MPVQRMPEVKPLPREPRRALLVECYLVNTLLFSAKALIRMNPNPLSSTSGGTWSVLSGESSHGMPLLVRLRQDLPNSGPHRKLDFQVGIAISFLHPSATGMPNEEEMEVLQKVEANLIQALDRQPETLFVGVATFGGVREYILYTSQPGEVDAIFQAFRNQEKWLEKREFQLMLQSDPDWQVYEQLGAAELSDAGPHLKNPGLGWRHTPQ